ncbi:unnamed protein product [Cochlearia groenlandica]
MNNHFVFFIVIAYYVGTSNSSDLFLPNTVYVRNSFTKNNDILQVHCKSEEDDLGGHLLHRHGLYTFRFGDKYFGGTTFYCQLRHGDNFTYYRYFRAYKEDPILIRFGARYLWDARDDGIYYGENGHKIELKFLWFKS